MVAVAPPALHDRLVWGTFATSGAPPRVDYCGRRYYPGEATETLAGVQALLAENRYQGLTQIDTTPSGMQVVAHVIPSADRARLHSDVCTMVLWVRTGPNAYLGYSLSGGP
jgi:hypothetical protein